MSSISIPWKEAFVVPHPSDFMQYSHHPNLDHGEQHVKKIYSTVAIDKRGHALKPVRGYSFTGEDTNTRVPWLLKNEIFFNISIYISFMRTLIYKFLLMGNSHIIGDLS